MKRIKKCITSILLSLSLVLTLPIVPNTPVTVEAAKKASGLDASIKGFMKAAKSCNYEKMNTYVKSWPSKTMLSDIQNYSALQRYLKRCNGKLRYRILNKKVSKRTAKVQIQFRYVDASEFFINSTVLVFAEEAKLELKNPDFIPDDATNVEEEQLMRPYINKAYRNAAKISPINRFKTEVLSVSFVKTSSGWKIKKMSDPLENVILCNLLFIGEEY